MPDFARSIVEYFVERRGKASAVSGADQEKIGEWEAKGIPLEVIFEGIDGAFDRRKEPPKSLSDCGRFVTNAFKRWSRSDVELGLAAPASKLAARGRADREDDETIEKPRDPVATRTIEALRSRASSDAPDPVRRACVAVLDELESIREEEGALDATTLALVDDAVARHVLLGLDEESRAEVVAQVERALLRRGRSPAARDAAWDRALREDLGARFGLQPLLRD